MRKDEIAKQLKIRSKTSGVGLPRDIDFVIEKEVLKVFVKKPTQNMQTNGCVFEGWVIAISNPPGTLLLS